MFHHQTSFIPQMDHAPSPNWALYMLPPLFGIFLPPFFNQLTPHTRLQFNHHFLREASMLRQVSLVHPLGPVASLLQSNHSTYKVTCICVIICSMSFPHSFTVSSRMRGPHLAFFPPHHCISNSSIGLGTLHCKWSKTLFEWMHK